MRKIIHHTIIIFSLFLTANLSYLQSNTTIYSYKNNINSLAVEENFLWAATSGGVVRWNISDHSYKALTTLNGLVDNVVNSVAIDSQGNKWFATINGVSKLDTLGHWITYTTKDGLLSNSISSVHIDLKGYVWFVSHHGITRMDVDGNVISFQQASKDETRSMERVKGVGIDSKNRKWVIWSTPKAMGVSVLENDKNWNHVIKEEFPYEKLVGSIAFDREGNTWFGCVTAPMGFSIPIGFLLKLDPFGNFTTYFIDTENKYKVNKIYAIYIDSEDNKWCATEEGIYVLDRNERWAHYSMVDGLSNNHVRNIVEDSYGNKWFGTTRDGILKLNPKGKWESYRTKVDIVSNHINLVFIDSKDNKWFATRNGVSKYKSGNWKTFTTEDGLASNSVRSIFEDRYGNLWFVHSYWNISKLDPEGELEKYLDSEFSIDSPSDVKIDEEGNIWYFSRNGIDLLNLRRKLYSYNLDIPSYSRRAYALDDNEVVWVATTAQERLMPYEITLLKGKEVYSPPEDFSAGTVLSLIFDRNRNLWIITIRNGVLHFDKKNRQWKKYIEDQRLPSNRVHSVNIDSHGNTWFATSNGLCRMSNTGNFKTYTFNEGLASRSVGSFAFDSEGNMWTSSSGGITRFSKEVFQVE